MCTFVVCIICRVLFCKSNCLILIAQRNKYVFRSDCLRSLFQAVLGFKLHCFVHLHIEDIKKPSNPFHYDSITKDWQKPVFVVARSKKLNRKQVFLPSRFNRKTIFSYLPFIYWGFVHKLLMKVEKGRTKSIHLQWDFRDKCELRRKREDNKFFQQHQERKFMGQQTQMGPEIVLKYFLSY